MLLIFLSLHQLNKPSHLLETLQIDKETTRKLNSLLSEADLVKFAKSTPLSHEIEDDRKDAENILNDLKPLIIEEAENDELE